MTHITSVVEHKSVLPYLQKRNLTDQYKKAKNFLLSGKAHLVQFKLRRPVKDKIYYFRINKQYRAFCYFENSEVKVFTISDHQNG